MPFVVPRCGGLRIRGCCADRPASSKISIFHGSCTWRLSAPIPHARLLSVDLEPTDSPGRRAAFTALELGPRRIHATVTHPALRLCGQPILADGRVRYVGEPIAAVVAESRASAEMALRGGRRLHPAPVGS